MKRLAIHGASALFLTALVLACSSDTAAGPGSVVPPLSDLIVSIHPIGTDPDRDVILPGQHYDLETSAFDTHGNFLQGLTPDSVQDHYPDVASISASNLIVLLKPGQALFTGWLAGRRHDFGFTVEQPESTIQVLGDTMAVTALQIVPGGQFHFVTRNILADGSSELDARIIHWLLSDSTRATLVSDGGSTTFTAGTSAGPVTLTASREGKATAVTIDIEPTRYAQLAAGVGHTCALTATGQPWCWGAFDSGQAPRLLAYAAWTPRAVTTSLRFGQLVAGGRHTCGLTVSGFAYCWGDNRAGQLGDGTTTSSATPVAVQGDLAFAGIAAGESTTCGITPQRAAYCWGAGLIGVNPPGSLVPVAVTGGHRFVTISTTMGSVFPAGNHTCAVDDAGATWCWGANNYGQLGDSSATSNTVFGVPSATPVRVHTDSQFVELALLGDVSCGRTAARTVMCWGNIQIGQAGGQPELVPTAFPSLSPATRVTAGTGDVCALDPLGHLTCLHHPTFGSTTFTGVWVGAHGCALQFDGMTVCWGDNDSDQLGTPVEGGSQAPVLVTGQ